MSPQNLQTFVTPSISIPKTQRTALFFAASMALALAGCASGSSSSSGPAPSSGPTTTTATNTNPPSLAAPPAATAVNTYVGTQVQASGGPANVVSLQLDRTARTYAYQAIALPNMQPDPLPNSAGSLSLFADFTAFGDTTGATMNGMTGPQYFGVGAEQSSRLAFFAPYTGQQLTAVVPKQTSTCVTPTAAATYQFITLFNASFVPATDAAWGTVSVAASGTAFTFTNAQQFTQPGTAASTAATTTLIPFAPGTCAQSATNPEAGYLIDTPANVATLQPEIQSFLGPTGVLVANLEGVDGSGNPLPLPGVLGMVQPSAPVDLAKVVGAVSSGTTYKSYFYQPAGGAAVQYGLVGQQSSGLIGVDNTIFTATKTAGIEGAWQAIASFSTPFSANFSSGGGIVFGAQDPTNPGLFPNAQFLYPGAAVSGAACPDGTTAFSGAYCASPSVAMVGISDGKYVILATGAYQVSGGTPTVIVMVQD